MSNASLISTDWKLHLETSYACVLVHADQGILLCEVTREYIPIKTFKAIFGELSHLIKTGSFHKFIFDKRALTAFHQPSMEWYYVNWKTEMLQAGLYQHRKLLPKAEWFRKTVEIARKSIQPKLPTEIQAQLDIKYCESIHEAIAQ